MKTKKYAVINANSAEWTKRAFDALNGQCCLIVNKSDNGIYTRLRPNEKLLRLGGVQLGLNLENKHFSEQNAIYVDVKSEKCPDNVSIVMGHLRKAKPKSIVLVEATDQNTQKDIPAMCSALDYTLIAQLESESIFSFLIEK